MKFQRDTIHDYKVKSKSMESFEHQFFCNNEMSKKTLKKMRKNYYYIPEKYNFGKFMGAEDGGGGGSGQGRFPS